MKLLVEAKIGYKKYYKNEEEIIEFDLIEKPMERDYHFYTERKNDQAEFEFEIIKYLKKLSIVFECDKDIETYQVKVSNYDELIDLTSDSTATQEYKPQFEYIITDKKHF